MPLLRNTAYASASAGSAALMFALLLLAAWKLGADAFGRFSFALALAVIFETLMDFGLKEVTTRGIARDPSRARPYLQNTFGLKLLLGVVSIYLLAVTTAALRPGERDVWWACVALGVAAVLRSYMTTIRSVFYGIDRFDLETAVLLMDRVLVLACGAAALFAGAGAVGLAVAFVAARVAALALASGIVMRTVGSPRPVFDLPFWRDLQMRALPFGAFVVVLQLYNYVDTVMLGVMRGDGETGLYNAAYRLYEGFAHVPSIITVVLTPRLAREFVEDRARHRRTAFGGMAAAAALGVPAALAAYTLAVPAFELPLLAAYASSAAVFRILGAGFVIVFPLAVLHAVAISANAERLMLVTALVGCTVNVAANLLLIPQYGMHGAAAATVIGEAVSLAVLGAGMWRRAARPPVSGSAASEKAELPKPS